MQTDRGWPPALLLLWACVLSAFVLATLSPIVSASSHRSVSAAGICPPDADPCVIDSVVDFDGPASISVGDRDVVISGAGRLNADTSLDISCRNLVVDVGDRIAFDLRGASAEGWAASLEIYTRGDVTLDGKILGTSGFVAAPVGIYAGGSIHILRKVDLRGINRGWHGSMALDAGGSAIIEAPLLLTESPQGASYDGVEIQADDDVIVRAPISVSGKYYAPIHLQAWRDIFVDATLDVSSAYRGGDIDLDAGRNVIVGSGGNDCSLLAVGQKILDDEDLVAYPGRGGDISIYGSVSISIASRVRLVASGRGAGGGAGSIWMRAPDLDLGNRFILTAEGGAWESGSGGSVELEAYDRLRVGPTAYFDLSVSGDRPEAADVRLSSAGGLLFEGNLWSPSAGWRGGSPVEFQADGDLGLSGTVVNGGDVRLSGCRTELLSGARVVSVVEDVEVSGGEFVNVTSGAALLAKEGATSLSYGNPAVPPLIDGNVSPAPSIDYDPRLPLCSQCGNSIVERDESCDDGNAAAGDGCDADCQDEACVGQSPGYPERSLCEDDNACTADFCDRGEHACKHQLSCNDGIECTADSCTDGACVHVPDDLACDDGNPCTDDTCVVGGGCDHSDNSEPCDDGNICTLGDACLSGACRAGDGDLADSLRLTAALKPSSAGDGLTARVRFDDALLSEAPDSSGLRLTLVYSGRTGYEALLSADDIEDANGAGSSYLYSSRYGQAASAPGLQRLLLKRRRSRVRVVAKVRGVDLDALAGQASASLALLFGSDPVADACISALRASCRTSPDDVTRVVCSGNR